MRNLKVWQKLVLMGAITMLPFAVVTYKWVSEINTQGVAFTRKELRGLDSYSLLLRLARDLQRHRGVAAIVLSGDSSFRERLTSSSTEIDGDIKRIDEAVQRDDAVLRGSAKATALTDASRDLVSTTPSLSVDESYKRHTKVVADALALILDVADQTNLSLDPDVVHKHLRTALTILGPDLAEALGQARALGAALVTSKQKAPEQVERLKNALVIAEYFRKAFYGSLGSAATANETVRAQLDAPARRSGAAVQDATRYVARLANDPRSVTDIEDYFSVMSHGIDSIFEVGDRVQASLNERLNNRMNTRERELRTTLAWIAVVLVALGIIGLLMIRDVTVTLGQVVGVANQIAVGELAAGGAAGSRKDEIGVLARAFDGMVAALKDMVGVAERIASGDLNVTVRPRSKHDALGNALADMIARLSALVSDVRRSGILVNSSVSEIAATARQQQATANEIAATTTEIGATSKEISATSKELVKTMSEVSEVAEQSAVLAGSGQSGLTRMEQTMRHVMEAAGAINAKLTVLNDRAGNINQVVTTITKVADQTNLLSLNAAIEAEKAGEYGRGFAVVATEIRRLADQTAVATYDIEQMVKEIQSAVSAGVMGMDKFSEQVRIGMQEIQQVGDQLSQIIQRVQALAPRVEAVSEGMKAQATGAEQITQALAQLGESAHQTADSLRQSTQAIEGLNQAATGLQTGVSRFKLVA